MRLASLLCFLLAACARPQILLHVDTDAPVMEQLAGDPALSPDAAIDMLRVDVIGRDNRILDACEFDRPSAQDWPLAFAVSSDLASEFTHPGPMVRLRLRAFARRFAQNAPLPRGSRLCGQPAAGDALLSEPSPGATLDRLVDLSLPQAGVVQRRVHLSFDCMSASSGFDPPSTCLDRTRPLTSPDQGIIDMEREIGEGAATQVGTAQAARAVPCRPEVQAPHPDTICIPGGFLLLGDLAFRANDAAQLDAFPLRPVWLSPFFLDRTEFTVGRLRPLTLGTGALPKPDPPADEEWRRRCTWDKGEQLPVNCYSYSNAARACQASSGDLSSEAQFEHAARGRGRRWRFPWGQGDPGCCADVSRDGVMDLAGNHMEYQRDKAQRFDAPCWNQNRGVLRDPVCTQGEHGFSMRGASTVDGVAAGMSAFRRIGLDATKGADFWGFRCAYRGH